MSWLPFRSKPTVQKAFNWVRDSWRILEWTGGDWQRNIEYSRETVLSFFAAFTCISLISADIAKLKVEVKERKKGVYVTRQDRYTALLRKPNHFQNHIQFFEAWVVSKLVRGNTYIFKERNAKGEVTSLYVLNPDLVTVLVADSGEVFYQLGEDNIGGISESKTVPAREIIHDRFNCLFHPLVGCSPLYASSVPAYQGLKIQENGAKFFENMSRPSGILAAPGAISDETAKRIKDAWETNYGGDNIGRIAVVGDDLKYIPLSVNASDAQLIEQLRMDGLTVCSCFKVPAYKVLHDAPKYDNVEVLDQQYYSQCLQSLIESIELCLEMGLDIDPTSGRRIEFDLDGLLRMDTQTQINTLAEAVKGGLKAPNEARLKLNDPPMPGGENIFLQQQMWPLTVLAQRTAEDLNPSKTNSSEPVNIASSEEDVKMLGEMSLKRISEWPIRFI